MFDLKHNTDLCLLAHIPVAVLWGCGSLFSSVAGEGPGSHRLLHVDERGIAVHNGMHRHRVTKPQVSSFTYPLLIHRVAVFSKIKSLWCCCRRTRFKLFEAIRCVELTNNKPIEPQRGPTKQYVHVHVRTVHEVHVMGVARHLEVGWQEGAEDKA